MEKVINVWTHLESKQEKVNLNGLSFADAKVDIRKSYDECYYLQIYTHTTME